MDRRGELLLRLVHGHRSGLFYARQRENPTGPEARPLNQQGLFTSVQDARAFARKADQTYSDYGPFCAYGLYRIPF